MRDIISNSGETSFKVIFYTDNQNIYTKPDSPLERDVWVSPYKIKKSIFFLKYIIII